MPRPATIVERAALTAALKPPSVLRTATGEPPLGRNAEFFTDDQGEILARQSTPPLILDQDWCARARRRQVAGHAAGLSHQRPTLQLMRRDAALCDERELTPVTIDVTDVANMGKRPHLVTSKERSPLSTLLNVVSVKGDLYLLAVDAVQAEIVAPRSVLGAIDLYCSTHLY
jgi:hypothetical protein